MPAPAHASLSPLSCIGSANASIGAGGGFDYLVALRSHGAMGAVDDPVPVAASFSRGITFQPAGSTTTSAGLVLLQIETLKAAQGAEMVKPAEKIDSIRIHHVSGLGHGGGAAADGSARTPVNQALDGILEMAVQLPALKKLARTWG